MDVELAWLRTWIDVVDSGGFARAAARLHLSQPRVSARVASLERALGCVLIERRIRPLTRDGAHGRAGSAAGGHPQLYRDVGLWWHSERPLSRAAQAFVDLVLRAQRPAGTLPIPSA